MKNYSDSTESSILLIFLPSGILSRTLEPLGEEPEKSECSKLSAGVSRLLAVVECEVVISLAVKSSCLAKVEFGFCLSGLLSLSYGKGSSVSLVI